MAERRRNNIHPLMAALAEEQPFAAIALTVSNGHYAESNERPFSVSIIVFTTFEFCSGRFLPDF